MKKVLSNTPPEVGATLQKLRLDRGLTLEDLSRTAGVSKSMLSQIEREKANPTIAVAWRLANALGVTMAELLSSEVPQQDVIRLLESHETPTLSGEHAGYVLRILGPMDLAGKYEWYELMLAPGGALVSNPHDPGTTEHLTVLQGSVEIEVDNTRKKVKVGATARYEADKSHAIRNTGKTEAKALMVVIHR
ncbi:MULTISPECIES: helix-turn-helix domain-containing protein [Undibacterium]|jgi:transcriptional regulator with XRE-family HTH domain|uniref:Helix-turn-helix transcriptional regulator n=1 Tax=Undibacterium aquatile TaxID=1537398 RepID=A0ABR6XEC1_9BURK|nr:MULTISPECIES: XRE family transcriptional regulator [Undibacterium]MBC3811247.1 helix-turn-helix transcriptional regulator [Undibacterium aquatile]MBC3877041.1 helix-turn-helix transcriptional regulator [Undibacterium sp. FT79W]MBC3929637.1 helix-turn-helix transcriptional regulator [Undibacterium sp. CY21W]MBK1891540.1 helix-turn-helix transcriptional regulator [Undibacterium sp. 14-3-2]